MVKFVFSPSTTFILCLVVQVCAASDPATTCREETCEVDEADLLQVGGSNAVRGGKEQSRRARNSEGGVSLADAVIKVPFTDPSGSIGKSEESVRLRLPKDIDTAGKVGLIVMLHGYSGWYGHMIESTLNLAEDMTAEQPFIVAAPEGRKDMANNRYWAAWGDWCGFCSPSWWFDTDTLYQPQLYCNGDPEANTDVDYILALVAAVQTAYNVDPANTFVFGHSNGGAMAYRLACDASDVFAAAVSFSGAPPTPGSVKPNYHCSAERPISILQISGTSDTEVPYEGYRGTGNPYDGAAASASLFAKLNQCPKKLGELATEARCPSMQDGSLTVNTEWFDCDAYSSSSQSGPLTMRLSQNTEAGQNDTKVYVAPGCSEGTEVELWKIFGMGHDPFKIMTSSYRQRLIQWLFAHSRS
mmetsp:Transcript_124595/g.265749  ORF Transcript_124595/g.265749 Transcript_124595/m.265749 type:complete len:414 (-) Transcript_124595:73-1314(-)